MRDMEFASQRLRAPSSIAHPTAEYEALYKRVKARQDQPEKLVKRLEEAKASGEPGLLDQNRIEYMMEEARARSFAEAFGEVTTEGAPNQVPYMVFLTPDTTEVYDVSLTGPDQQNINRTQIYAAPDTYNSTGWKEFTTPQIEYDADNPFYPAKAAILEAQAMDKSAYYMQRRLDKLAWDTFLASLVTTFVGTTVWTFRDADVTILPVKNDFTDGSAKSFWRNLRDHVFPYYDSQGKGDRIIDIHILATDLPFLFQVAPVGVTLGGFSVFQEQVYQGITDRVLTLYGHAIRLHPENNRTLSGFMYTRVGPVFKMWIPRMGDIQNAVPQTPGYRAFRLRAWYAVLQPSLWISNVGRFQWSITDTAG